MLSVFKSVRSILKLYGTGLGVKVFWDLAPEPPSLTHLTNPSNSDCVAPRRLASVDSWIQ